MADKVIFFFLLLTGLLTGSKDRMKGTKSLIDFTFSIFYSTILLKRYIKAKEKAN